MNKTHTRTTASIPAALKASVNLSTGTRGPTPRYSAGTGFDDEQMRNTPTLLIPIFGMPSLQVDELLRVIYSAQMISMAFRPILFSDMNIFAHARPFGWVLEHHMSEYDHAVLGIGNSWEESVIRHAQLTADYFKATNVVVPDPISGYRGLLRQLRDITNTEVGSPRPGERAETFSVFGWRSWLSDAQKTVHKYGVITASAGTVEVEIEGGRGDNLVVIDGGEIDAPIETFITEARARSWPLVHVETLELLDEPELRIALSSLLALGDADGTAILICSEELAQRLSKLVEANPILIWTSDPTRNSQRVFSMAEVELATTIRRASSALSRIN